jgi:hypothetical protein
MAKRKRTKGNTRIYKILHYTKAWATRTPLSTEVSKSWFICDSYFVRSGFTEDLISVFQKKRKKIKKNTEKAFG